MKTFWKVLGVTAALAALTPYRVEKDEETGEKRIEALLWKATAAPKEDEEKMAVDVSFGFNSPFAAKEEKEPLFDEEPVAEFTVDTADAAEETADEADEAAVASDETAEAADEAAAEAEVEAIENAVEAAPEETEEAEAAAQE